VTSYTEGCPKIHYSRAASIFHLSIFFFNAWRHTNINYIGMLSLGCVVLYYMLNCFFNFSAYLAEIKPMPNYFFGLSSYLTQTTADAQLFRRPQPVTYRTSLNFTAIKFTFIIWNVSRLLRSWVRIPPVAWMFVCCECCVLSGKGLCDGLITRPEKSYRLWRVVVCDQETSQARRL